MAGANLMIEGSPVTIVGIAPPGFFGDTLGPFPPDFWIPLADEPIIRGRNSLLSATDQHWLYIIGRVKPGASLPAIESRVNAELHQWFLANFPAKGADSQRMLDAQHITLVPAGAGVASLKDNFAQDLRLLIAITGMVLLIACANLANLQLARGASPISKSLSAQPWAPAVGYYYVRRSPKACY